MMYTERAFQDAQMKGYQIRNRITGFVEGDETHGRQTVIDQDYFFTLHDPEFWQKFGEVRGWKAPQKVPRWTKEEGTRLIVFYPDDSWASWMHRYVDHAIEHGYNAHQEFFKQFYPVQSEDHDLNS